MTRMIEASRVGRIDGPDDRTDSLHVANRSRPVHTETRTKTRLLVPFAGDSGLRRSAKAPSPVRSWRGGRLERAVLFLLAVHLRADRRVEYCGNIRRLGKFFICWIDHEIAILCVCRPRERSEHMPMHQLHERMTGNPARPCVTLTIVDDDIGILLRL
jgi:hypothetical protein